MSDYQAIYDAVRSRIHGGDVGSIAREVMWQQFDISHQTGIALQEFLYTQGEQQRPSVLFKPTISLDGNMYCALYGEDLMEGVAGFGDTMEAAMRDFDKNWREQKAPTPATGRSPISPPNTNPVVT
jgi:hypothetical protein